jgi:hypothetical protein
MSISENQAKELSEKRQPIFGWVAAEDGWFYAPDDFAQTTAFISDDFEKFSLRSRSRWDLLEYLKAVFSTK